MQRWIPLGVGLVALVAGTLWLARDTRNSVAGVLVGAGIAISVDSYRRLVEQGEALARRYREDLDETRRTLYIAYAAIHGELGTRAEVAGTVANALGHHVEPGERLDFVAAAKLALDLQGATSPDESVGQEIRIRIQRISFQLGDQAPEPHGTTSA